MTTLTEGFLDGKIFSIVSDTAAEMGVRAFAIGGYVRDSFLGRPSNDIDIVVEGSGIELAEAVGRKVGSEVVVFRNFGTAMLRYHGLEVEFVGARKESYHRESRKPVVEDGTLEEDQARRDFTINAMAFSLQKEDFGALIDPFGGIRDLNDGIIRTPLDPDVTYSDDPLRMLRAIRFATKLSTPDHTFRIVPESLESMRRNRDRLDILSRERIAEELNKILVTPRPSMGFRLLDDTTLLEKILPELTALKGVETVEGRGHKENFSHSLQVLDNVAEAEQKAIAESRLKDYDPAEDGDGWVESIRTAPNVWLRWAALLHDIGKPRSKRYVPGIGWTFHGHEIISSRLVPKIFRELKLPQNEKMKYVEKLVSLHHRPTQLVDDEVTDSAVRRLIFDAGNELDDLMLLSNADITSKNPAKVARIRAGFQEVLRKMEDVEARDAIRNFKNPITGDYIMQVYGIEPCNTIGRIKDAVKEAILDGRIGNDFTEADALMRVEASKYGLTPMTGKVLIFSAPSGSGKSTIVNHLLGLHPEIEFSISATSRPPRGTEKDGVEYYFIDADTFRKRIAAGDFVEYEEVYEGRFYGTLKSEVTRIWKKEHVIIFDVDVKGGVSLKKYFGDCALSVFIQAPSVEELRRRLVARQTDSPEAIEERVAKAAEEMTFAPQFDKVLINDDLEKAYAESEQMVDKFLAE